MSLLLKILHMPTFKKGQTLVWQLSAAGHPGGVADSAGGVTIISGEIWHQADSFVLLLLPASQGWESISALVFIGGFSAATSMIIIATLALSNMLSNDVVMPTDCYTAALSKS